MATRWYWPTTMHTSMSCCSSHRAGERGPGVVADAAVGVELVGGPEQDGVGVGPARRIGTVCHAGDLLVGEPGGEPDRHVLAPLVGRPAEVAGAEDEQLALAGRQRAAVEEHAAEGRPPLQQPRVVGEGGEDVQLGAVEGAEALEQLGGLGVAALCGQRRDAGCHRVIMDQASRGAGIVRPMCHHRSVVRSRSGMADDDPTARRWLDGALAGRRPVAHRRRWTEVRAPTVGRACGRPPPTAARVLPQGARAGHGRSRSRCTSLARAGSCPTVSLHSDRERCGQPSRLLLPDGGPVLGEQHRASLTCSIGCPTWPRQYAAAPGSISPVTSTSLLALGVADMRPARMLGRFDDALATARPDVARAGGRRSPASIGAPHADSATWCERLAAVAGRRRPSTTTTSTAATSSSTPPAEPASSTGGMPSSATPSPAPSCSARWCAGCRTCTSRLPSSAGSWTPTSSRSARSARPTDTPRGRRRRLRGGQGRPDRGCGREPSRRCRPDADDPDDFRGAPLAWLLELLDGPVVADVARPADRDDRVVGHG